MSSKSVNLKTLSQSNGIFKDGDWIEKKDQDPSGDVRLIQLADIGENIFLNKSNRFVSKYKAKELKCTYLRKGDILISRLGEPLGKACIFPYSEEKSYITVVDVCIFRSDSVNTKWLSYWLNSPVFRNEVDKFKSGTTRKRISRRNIEKISFSIPEKLEQQKIVDKIEEFFSVINSISKTFDDSVKALIKLESKLLHDSFSGKLTEDWRNNRTEIETGIQLVSKYTRNLIEDRKLPVNWAKVRIGDIFEVYVGSTPSRKNKKYWRGNIPWVSSGEVSFTRIKDTNERITQEGLASSSLKIHPTGTILLGMIGEGKTRGQAAILDINATHNQNSAAIRLGETNILSEYVYYFFKSEYHKTRQIGSGNNQKALNKTRVSDIVIPIPSIEEQKEIVKILENFFSTTSVLKKELISLKKYEIGKIKQSILKKAFEGKLV